MYFLLKMKCQCDMIQDKNNLKGEWKMKALIMNCSPVRNGATAEIVAVIQKELAAQWQVKSVCIDDYRFSFCKGCRSCHTTAKCVQHDEFDLLMSELEWADRIVCVSPSYWADVLGQFKAFIDRCTPWCNTHEPHAALPSGKKGYVVALRTGSGMRECETITRTIEHFYGHLEIECGGSLGLPSVEYKKDVDSRRQQITEFCQKILEG